MADHNHPNATMADFLVASAVFDWTVSRDQERISRDQYKLVDYVYASGCLSHIWIRHRCAFASHHEHPSVLQSPHPSLISNLYSDDRVATLLYNDDLKTLAAVLSLTNMDFVFWHEEFCIQVHHIMILRRPEPSR